MQEDLAEAMQRYREKVRQWEDAQEALEQLTDKLEVSRNLLMKSQRRADGLKCPTGSLGERVGSTKSQKHTKGVAQPGL